MLPAHLNPMMRVFTILLAEDDPDDVHLILDAFAEAKLNVEVKVVSDGEEAVNYLAGSGTYANREQNPPPSLFLLDLNMPRRNGFEVLEWVRSQRSLKRLPVVVLSSSTQGPDVNHAYSLGANSYLVKVPQFRELVDRIRVIYAYWVERQTEWPDVSDADAANILA